MFVKFGQAGSSYNNQSPLPGSPQISGFNHAGPIPELTADSLNPLKSLSDATRAQALDTLRRAHNPLAPSLDDDTQLGQVGLVIEALKCIGPNSSKSWHQLREDVDALRKQQANIVNPKQRITLGDRIESLGPIKVATVGLSFVGATIGLFCNVHNLQSLRQAPPPNTPTQHIAEVIKQIPEPPGDEYTILTDPFWVKPNDRPHVQRACQKAFSWSPNLNPFAAAKADINMQTLASGLRNSRPTTTATDTPPPSELKATKLLQNAARNANTPWVSALIQPRELGEVLKHRNALVIAYEENQPATDDGGSAYSCAVQVPRN
jgi:hypothetical protein